MTSADLAAGPLRFRRMLKAKIHRIAVTETDLSYEGSLTLDSALMERADLVAFEAVEVANLNNGARFTTYLIPGGARECCLNGAAARLGEVGDLLIVMAYDLVEESASRTFSPIIVNPESDLR